MVRRKCTAKPPSTTTATAKKPATKKQKDIKSFCKKCKIQYKNPTQLWRHNQFKNCKLFRAVDIELVLKECSDCAISFKNFRVESNADFINVLLCHKKECRTKQLKNYLKGKKGDTRSLMTEITREPPLKQDLCCSGCLEVFPSKTDFLVHLKDFETTCSLITFKERVEMKCIICEKEFDSVKDLRDHMLENCKFEEKNEPVIKPIETNNEMETDASNNIPVLKPIEVNHEMETDASSNIPVENDNKENNVIENKLINKIKQEKAQKMLDESSKNNTPSGDQNEIIVLSD